MDEAMAYLDGRETYLRDKANRMRDLGYERRSESFHLQADAVLHCVAALRARQQSALKPMKFREVKL